MNLNWIAVCAAGALLWSFADTKVASSRTIPHGIVNAVCPQFIVAKSLIFPRPHATHVPADGRLIIISGVSANGSVTLQPRSGAPLFATIPTAVPSPLPSPNGPAVSTTYTAFRLPRLQKRETYTVFVQENAPSPMPKHCPNNVPLELGFFST